MRSSTPELRHRVGTGDALGDAEWACGISIPPSPAGTTSHRLHLRTRSNEHSVELAATHLTLQPAPML